MENTESAGRQGSLFVTPGDDFAKNLPRLLENAALPAALAGKKRILIKPNLVEAKPPPVTTPVALVAALVDFLRAHAPGAEIIIGEGCGSLSYDTWHPYAELGYVDLAKEKNIPLVDLNQEPSVKRSNPACKRWPEIHLPALAFDCLLISVPVLKAHTLSGVTLTMKNMMGLAPPEHYHQGGHWKKAAFHHRIHEAIVDLNRYRTPDFTILDATVGMSKAHLWGPTCNPPPNLLAAGFDPVSVDAYGAELLCRNWRDIGHISMAHGELGVAEPLSVVTV